MPKTIAITPSWYWPERIPRVSGVPPYSVFDLLVSRRARKGPEDVAIADLERSLSAGELISQVASVAAAIKSRGAERSTVRIAAPVGVEYAVLFLGALAAGCTVDATLAGTGGAGTTLAGTGGQGDITYDAAIASPSSEAPTGPESVESLALALDSVSEAGARIGVSQRALLARAISLAMYFEFPPEAPWVIDLDPSNWAFSATLGAALHHGSVAVLTPPGDADSFAAAVGAQQYQSVGVMDFQEAFVASRESKRVAKGLRGQLLGLILPVVSSFDASERRRIEKVFDCPSLTVYGLPETGPILASHPSWYLVESAGIPITNADVLPVDPRSGAKIQTLWELVEFAAVNVRSPMLATSRSSNGSWEPIGGMIATGVAASSDANGMIYLLPPGSI